MVEPMILLV